jgi:hypothetical protein
MKKFLGFVWIGIFFLFGCVSENIASPTASPVPQETSEVVA